MMESTAHAYGVCLAGMFALHAVGVVGAKVLGGDLVGSAPHLAGHLVATFLGFCALARLGVQGWWLDDTDWNAVDADRIGTVIPTASKIAVLMVAFQTYDTIVTASQRVLRGKSNEFLAHHILALLLAVLTLHYSVYHYYGIFFMGVTEISSVPFSVVDFLRVFPSLRKRYDTLNGAMRERRHVPPPPLSGPERECDRS